jgi:hypothetical protein
MQLANSIITETYFGYVLALLFARVDLPKSMDLGYDSRVFVEHPAHLKGIAGIKFRASVKSVWDRIILYLEIK